MQDAPSEVEVPQASAPHGKLSEELSQFVASLDGQDVTLGEIVDRIGDRGFGLLLLLLSLPAALPLPAPGYATPFGLAMIGLSVQMMRGRTAPWFPERTRARKVPYSLLDFSVRNGGLPLRFVELIVRPRLSNLARHRVFLAAVAVVILAMSCSMALPIPLTNTAPSFVIFVLAAGILEEDGLVLAGGVLLAPVAAAISAAAVYVATTVGLDAVETTLKPAIKGLLGM
ncbi:MAG: exopolysaccharide biosynthesis protein [Alphaproteobacteria bacterium]|nr:exopolysaccharide biosynthesis protein [Alphaproteobacteria bacterium]